MQVVKIGAVVVGVLLLVLIGPVLLGIAARSPIAMFALVGVGLVASLIVWRRRVDSSAHRSWFVRSRSRGATQAHDRLLDDVDDMRRRAAASQEQRHHDGE
ncbi:MAG TPA: hypothetical protein VFO07_05310 [Roseiflexaceae bacterium]|nr:hypothetical protein [Roseiflexaceae bacterium]